MGFNGEGTTTGDASVCDKGDRVEVLIRRNDVDEWCSGFAIVGKVSAVDRDVEYRYDVQHDDGRVFREAAPECVRLVV